MLPLYCSIEIVEYSGTDDAEFYLWTFLRYIAIEKCPLATFLIEFKKIRFLFFTVPFY
jgi:hypothetical protein